MSVADSCNRNEYIEFNKLESYWITHHDDEDPLGLGHLLLSDVENVGETTLLQQLPSVNYCCTLNCK